MRVPLSWIREFAPVEAPPATVADALNELGLIVDAVDVPGRDIGGVVAARVVEVRDHPEADRLTLVDVDAGRGDTAQVVCGARNLSPGDVVPLAPPGATLPGGIELERRKIRGQLSEGMLCSARELGLGDDHEGILHLPAAAELGSDVREVLGLDDAVFDLDITPNRPDAMSVVGVARDLAAKLGASFDAHAPAPAPGGPAAAETATVEVIDPDRCPRYLAMTGTVAMGPSPAWMARRLTLAGMRPISNVVDVTNYVLLERGQPLHAFDHDRLGGGGIRVRVAREGETITTLDGVERELGPEDLLICDADDVPQAIAGIMGAARGEVGDATARVLLESAYFTPPGILLTSKRLGLRTESSARFERGVDPNGVDVAARRAWELLEDVAGATTGEGAVDVYPAPVAREHVVLRTHRVNDVLGTGLTSGEIAAHLQSIHMGVQVQGETMVVEVPTFRPDVEREIDVVEEVARLHGYNRVERTLPRASGHVGRLSGEQRERRLVADTLAGLGLSEAMTLSLLAPRDLEAAGHAAVGIEVENPLRVDESLLRPAVLPGLLRSVAFNAAHGLADVRLFEVGHVFHAPPGERLLPEEREHVAGALAGSVRRRPHEDDRPVDVHDAVGLVEAMVGALRLADWSLEPAQRPGFHPGRCAAVFVDGSEAGVVGAVAPEVVGAMELPETVVAFELDVDRLVAASRRIRRHVSPSRFPASWIDLAFAVPLEEPARSVEGTLRAAGGDVLEDVALFDVFESEEALGAGRRSLAFRLRFRAADRTLTDDEVAELRSSCIRAVEQRHRAELRG